MFLSLACPRLISQLYLIFVPFCSARFLLSWAWKESEDCISPTLPDLAKQLPSIALRDHVPSSSKHRSSSLRAKLLPSFRSSSPLAKHRARLHEGLPALVRVGMLTHSKSLSTLPASSAHICLYVAFILQTASTTAPLNCFPAGITCAHEQAGRISPRIPL